MSLCSVCGVGVWVAAEGCELCRVSFSSLTALSPARPSAHQDFDTLDFSTSSSSQTTTTFLPSFSRLFLTAAAPSCGPWPSCWVSCPAQRCHPRSQSIRPFPPFLSTPSAACNLGRCVFPCDEIYQHIESSSDW